MTDFATFVNIIIDELTKEGRKHTAETRKYSANRLLMFMGDNPTPMDKWDESFVLDYETWLKTQGLSASTTAFYLSQLCAFYKQAVKKGKIQGHDIFRLVNKTPAPKLAAQQFPSIAELRYLQTLNLNKSQDFARDMFLFSLYARGMNYVDMAYLKKSNVKDGMLTYISHTSDNNPIGMTPALPSSFIHPFDGDLRLNSAMIPVADSLMALLIEGTIPPSGVAIRASTRE